MAFSGEELDRYARHIVLREVGGPGQARLKAAHIAIVGAGGLGCPALLYLAAAGVGRLTIIDDDVVSLSNLQRQVLFTTDDVGQSKVSVAQKRLTALNPHIEITAHSLRLSAENAHDLLHGADLVLDGCDSFETRTVVNAACVQLGVPLLSGALSQWEGQIALYDPTRGGPCFTCIFPDAPGPGQAPSCAEAGVLGALAGNVGSIMAIEAIKHVTKAGASLQSRMLIHDALWGEDRRITLTRQADCPICGHLQN